MFYNKLSFFSVLVARVAVLYSAENSTSILGLYVGAEPIDGAHRRSPDPAAPDRRARWSTDRQRPSDAGGRAGLWRPECLAAAPGMGQRARCPVAVADPDRRDVCRGARAMPPRH